MSEREHDETEQINAFVALVRNRDPRILSTGIGFIDPEDINYPTYLFNVIESTDDPKIVGASWRKLLTYDDIGKSDQTYKQPAVNNQVQKVINRDQREVVGETCFFMPICDWDDHHSKDKVACEHLTLRIMVLTGYHQSESAITFLMRMPAPEPYVILYHDINGWDFRNINNISEARDFILSSLKANISANKNYFIFNRDVNGRVLELAEVQH